MSAREQAADEWVAQQLAQAPPLSQRQRAKLAELLRPVRDTMTAEQYAQHVETLAAQAPPLKPTQTPQLSGLSDYAMPQPDSSERRTGNRRTA